MKIWKEKDPTTKGSIWRADFRVNKKRYRPSAYTRGEIEQFIIQVKTNATRKKYGLPATGPKITVADLVAEHIKDFDSTVEYYRRGKVVVELFQTYIGKDTTVEDVTTSDLKGFIRYRRTQNPKLQNSSINKDLTFISKMFSSAHEYFKALNDFKAPKMPWEAESTKRRERVIYEEESQKLLEYLRDPKVHPREKPDSPQIRGDYADMLELCLHTSARWGEIAQIEWSMVNIQAAEIVLPKRITKTEEPRTLPLNSRAKEILTHRVKTKWTIWVFPRKDGLSYRKYYYDRLRSIAKKLKLPFGREAGFTLHTTRHTAISRLLDHGVDIATIQQISGHSDREIAIRYTHTSRKRIHEAVETLAKK